MKIIIIEDEVAAYQNIRSLLLQARPEIEILDNFDTVSASVAWLRSHPAPDLIFMDIQLADGSSFNIFECVTIEAPIIFTTAYDEYAINAFQVNSIDYLLKPITHEGIERSLNKYDRLNQASIQQAVRNIDLFMRPKEYMQRILVPVKDRIVPVKTDDIAHFYNTNGTTEVVTTNQTSYKLDKSLDSIMARLNPSLFYRANRQFILAKEAIESITIWFDSRLLVNLKYPASERIYISKNKAAEFKEWFASM